MAGGPERLVLSAGPPLPCPGVPAPPLHSCAQGCCKYSVTSVWRHPSTSTSCFSYLDYYITIDIPVLKIRPPGFRYAHQAFSPSSCFYSKFIFSPISFSFLDQLIGYNLKDSHPLSFHFGSFEVLVLSWFSPDPSSKARCF